MIEQSILDQALGAIGHAAWPVLIGYIILVVVGVWRSITHERFVGRAGDWSSAVSTMLGGVGLALAAGGIWWQVLAVAILAAPSSSGFWRLVRGSIPVIGAGLMLIILSVALSGCAAFCGGLAQVDSALDDADDALDPEPEEGSVAAKLRATIAMMHDVVLTGLHICAGNMDLLQPAAPEPDPKPADEALIEVSD